MMEVVFVALEDEPSVVMPQNARAHDAQIRRAGILERVQTGFGLREGLLHWAAIDVQPYGTSDLLLCAGFPGGEFTTRPLARNCVANSYDGISPPLTFEQLRLLESLAIGSEQFNVEPGRRFVFTGVEPPGRRSPFAAGTVLVIDVVTFGHVAFRGSTYIPRARLVFPAFREMPTYDA